MKLLFFFLCLLGFFPVSEAGHLDRGKCIHHNIGDIKLHLDQKNWVLTNDSNFRISDFSEMDGWYPGLHTDFGDSLFYRRGFDAPNFAIENDNLVISLLPDGQKVYGGIVQSLNKNGDGFYFDRGYAEARMLLPAAKNTWSAFWLLSKDGFLRDDVIRTEIDVVEAYGGDDPRNHHSSIHVWPSSNSKYRKDLLVQDCVTKVQGSMLDGKFHLFGVLLDDDYVYIYYDRILIKKFPRLSEFVGEFYLLLNLTTHGKYSQVDEKSDRLVVDYVKIWRRR